MIDFISYVYVTNAFLKFKDDNNNINNYNIKHCISSCRPPEKCLPSKNIKFKIQKAILCWHIDTYYQTLCSAEIKGTSLSLLIYLFKDFLRKHWSSLSLWWVGKAQIWSTITTSQNFPNPSKQHILKVNITSWWLKMTSRWFSYVIII